MRNFIIILTWVILANSLFAADINSFKPVDPNEIPSLLNMIADAAENNYTEIKTWKGEVISEMEYVYEGKAVEKIFKSNTNAEGPTPRAIKNTAETITKFCLDAEKDTIFADTTFVKPSNYVDLDTGRDLGASGVPGEQKGILTKDYFLKVRPAARRNGAVTKHTAIKEKRETCVNCQNPPLFDPRETFYSGRPVWETLRSVSKWLKEKGALNVNGQSMTLEIQKEGDSTIYRLTIPNKVMEGTTVLNTMLFSSDEGFNIIMSRVSEIDGRVLQNATWDYEISKGIYLPKQTVQENYNAQVGSLSYRKKMLFKNVQVNQPISAETFSITNLGLKDGDTYDDRIENKRFIFRGGEIRPEGKKSGKPEGK
jgi:hypothetical protein